MRRSILAFMILSLGLSGAALAAAEDSSLYETLSRRSEVKVYVAPPTDASEKKALDTSLLKQAVEKALQGRKSIHFKIAPSEAEAELAVDTEVKGFLFTEHDPVDMLVGVGAAAMDAATIDHYAASDADITVRDLKKGSVLWKGEVRATVTDHTMTESESHQRICDRLAEMLMREAFGKKKK